ncbi:MAG: PIN domain-containing protein [Phycisphaerales bacterium]
MHATFTAVYDACVFYPAPLRDLLLRLATTGLIRARWTARIHDEWTRSILRDRPDLDSAKLQRTRELADAHVPECLVEGYEQLVPSLVLPDPDDRHVLAAAIRCGADLIVTFNLADFPATTLGPLGIEAQHPDEFVRHLLDLDTAAVVRCVREQRAALRNPRHSAGEILETLHRQGLPNTVGALRPYVSVL